MWLVYRILTSLLAPFWLALLLFRQRGGARARERLGFFSSRMDGPIWIQAVSVGEVRIALRLSEALARLGFPVALTSTTAGGLSLAAKEGSPELLPQAFPLDLPSCMKRALARMKPRALVLVETEIWPALFREARNAGVPTFIVNGRLSDRGLRRTLRFKRLFALALKDSRVSAQSEEHAARYQMIGTLPDRVVVQGNLKYDLQPPSDFEKVKEELSSFLSDAPVWVAGSVREGEEAPVIQAFAAVRASIPSARLILAPRHLGRVQVCIEAARAQGFWICRRSDGAARNCDLLVLDTVGELWSAYALGLAAFVGGSLVPFGGQNILEPAFLGKPVLFGPSTENFREEAERLVASGGGTRVKDAASLAEAVASFLSDPEKARAAGEKARDAVIRHAGATGRTARWITEYIPGI